MRKALSVIAIVAVFGMLGMAVAQWTVTVTHQPGSKGYAKSAGLPRAFIDTVDISASLTGDFRPLEGVAQCSDDQSQCGSVNLKFSSTSPFPIHLSSVSFDVSQNFGPGNAACGVGIFPADATQALNVTVPAGSVATPGQSSTVVIPGIVAMASGAPESCADQVWFAPISGLTGNRA
jgi:hypothetical protein